MSYNWERPKTKLDKLKEKPKNRNLLIAITISFVIFGILQVLIFPPIEIYLRSLSDIYGLTNLGVLELEFAWTEARVNSIFSVWEAEGIFQEIIVTILDFIYLTCYSILISGLILLVARRLHDKLQKTELKLVFIPILAGIFDIVENCLLLMMLGSNQAINFLFPLITSICALIKFTLVFVGIISFLIGIVGLILYHYEILSYEN